MVTISCSGKFHAFALAEQLERHGLLNALYTSYAWQKNTLFRKVARRLDKEAIPVSKIHTTIPLAVPMKLFPGNAYLWNDWFDKHVARCLGKKSGRVFIGWSGMSLQAIRKAKRLGMTAIVERGSSHIQYQDEILREEYGRFGKPFSIDKRVIAKELAEYAEADFISVPSKFAYNSFISRGIPASKLVLNNYGFGEPGNIQAHTTPPEKFKILYLGKLSVQKGLHYLFEALRSLPIPEKDYEVQFIGAAEPEIETLAQQQRMPNWIFSGHINYYDLPAHLAQCSVAVQPSLQEGLSMVIPQMLAAGIPVIASTNSGGEDVIREGETGFVVPVRNPQAIAEKIMHLYHNPDRLAAMRVAASQSLHNGLSWPDYGNRYAAFIKKITTA
jgi:glycosyltransferase involved in cell wall biosynthesis